MVGFSDFGAGGLSAAGGTAGPSSADSFGDIRVSTGPFFPDERAALRLDAGDGRSFSIGAGVVVAIFAGVALWLILRR